MSLCKSEIKKEVEEGKIEYTRAIILGAAEACYRDKKKLSSTPLVSPNFAARLSCVVQLECRDAVAQKKNGIGLNRVWKRADLPWRGTGGNKHAAYSPETKGRR